ncbi:MAG: IS66 family transposase [Anaerolineae bacterium]|nr:IS66 family transposase [Anaerolineae bacterium]
MIVTNVNKTITSEVLVSYVQCPRKAHMLLYSDEEGAPHEYVRILEQRKIANRDAYLASFRREHPTVCQYSTGDLGNGSDFFTNVTLRAGVFEATCGILTKVASSSSLGEHSYEPTTFVGTHRISKDQKLELFFAACAVEQIQGTLPAVGRIVGMGPKSHRVKLENSGKTLAPLLEDLQEWTQAASPELPPLILNKHCPYCQFRLLCRAQAEKEDNLSLLDRVMAKVIRRYEKKGIFTVKQLSYLYKPRRRKKRPKNPLPAVHKPELQALAIRTGKIYLQDLPELDRKPVELFLDIEGVPDQQYEYLIGLLVCEDDNCKHYSFWANAREDEAQIWQQFVEKVDQYPDAPIYHYGSYESRAVAKLTRRYKTDSETLKSRLVNVNTHIYGKVYFPVRSNRLKDIGAFIGATWTSPDASGLQSLVWRSRWDGTCDARYQDLLITYNREDCQALKLLADELTKIKGSADTIFNVDFVNQPKCHVTEESKRVHSQFEALLKSAHADYNKKKVSFRQQQGEKGREEELSTQKARRRRGKRPKPTRIVQVPQRRSCPRCEDSILRPTERKSKRLIIDLARTPSGIRKTVTEYVGSQGYCPKCYKSYAPPSLRKFGIAQLYGDKFKAWHVYLRIALRMPYESITELTEEQFAVKMPMAALPVFVRDLGCQYAETEEIISQRLLESPFIHVDETPVNIKGEGDQYIWVFTNGIEVVFKLSETREAAIAHEFLTDYGGTLISDFYPGYDSMQCRQQKCWVHLIRDLNNDLWAAPFDAEFEAFVLEVRNLFVPIMEVLQENGLRKRYLDRFKHKIDNFYKTMIIDKRYRSDLAIKYQQRFERYRSSLFTFVEHNGIPWNNNSAERALRHLTVQEKISGFFFKSLMPDYLRLLGIRQTCRFRGKSFLRFLFSGERDVDMFDAQDE